jgi:hypothetical protein
MTLLAVSKRRFQTIPNLTSSLQRISKGLDDSHPFDDTPGVDVLLQEAERMLSPDLEAVGAKNAARIWGFMSKFVILDRFSEVLGAADNDAQGWPVPRKTCSSDYLGTGAKVTYLSRTT